ncbi:MULTISPECIES: AMP-binding protein [Gordonia]|uniref:Putative fatty-acid--CoA ligase n=2 Tax=Gordonia TaxID=2053 RepID=H5TX73_9ACTN|nr:MULTISPECIES: AMP-binding protein [Gordonia]NKY94939.1 AMP-binding protein [Gordonia sputi]GAB38081.1 putative fatty-acid--CoA ligase [Gordonia sputi NBRC 100414]
MTVQSISSVFADRARTSPGEVMVIDAHGPVTAGEIDVRANRLAHLLQRHHVAHDDVVEVALHNSAAFVVACVAVWRAGATPMPLDPVMPADEREMLERIAQPRVIVGDNVSPRTVTVDENDARDLPADTLPDIWASSWKAPASSGSTGLPKIVRSMTPALVDPGARVAPFFPCAATQLVTSPLWHSTAFTYAFRGLTAGHRLIIEPDFDERRFLELVDRHSVTWTVLSPPSIRRLVRLPEEIRAEHDMSSLASILHIGGRCPVPDKRALIKWLGAHRVVEVYAGSESNGVTMVTGHEWLAHPGTVGRPIGGTEVAIRRDDGTRADTGETGLIWMRRGDGPSYSYLGAQSRRGADGWDTLGDLGFLDADENLYVMDRAADVIRSGDVAMYPADIEQVVEQLPFVRGAVAFADVDSAGRQHLSVSVDIADNDASAALIADHVQHHFGSDWRPVRVILTTSPLRNDAGKIRRRALAGCGQRESA